MPRPARHDRESARPRPRLPAIVLRMREVGTKVYEPNPWRVRSLPSPCPRPSAASATIVRPESSTTAPVSCCPFGVGANGTMVPALSGAYALITTYSAHDDPMSQSVPYSPAQSRRKFGLAMTEDSSCGERITHKRVQERRRALSSAPVCEVKTSMAESAPASRRVARALSSTLRTPGPARRGPVGLSATFRSPAACRQNSGFRRRSRASRRSRRDPSAPERSRGRR